MFRKVGGKKKKDNQQQLNAVIVVKSGLLEGLKDQTRDRSPWRKYVWSVRSLRVKDDLMAYNKSIQFVFLFGMFLYLSIIQAKQ